MSARRVDTFFYGLFMDADVLREAGIEAVRPRRAWVDDFALRIGARATLVPEAGARAFGRVIALTHGELERLYGGPGLEDYRPEAVCARLFGGPGVAALCYVLAAAPDAQVCNAAYAERLARVLVDNGLPVAGASLETGP